MNLEAQLLEPPSAPCGDPRPAVRLPRLAPGIRQSLLERGVGSGPEAGESADHYQARVETALMALFRDTRGGEEFEALHRCAEASLRRWVLSAPGGGSRRVDPSELLQDALVNIYRYAGTFRDEHAFSFRAWAQVVCRNVVRRAHSVPRTRVFAQLSVGHLELADGGAGPLQQATEGEQRLDLSRAYVLLLLHYAAAFRELSPRDRRALRMVEVEGQSYQEAGARLAVGMSNMKMIMFRARRRLRAHMARSMGLEQPPRPARIAG